MKLGQLAGVPEKKNEFVSLDGGYAKGFNECKSLYDSLEIKLDVDKMRKIYWEDLRNIVAPHYISFIKALASNLERILKVGK